MFLDFAANAEGNYYCRWWRFEFLKEQWAQFTGVVDKSIMSTVVSNYLFLRDSFSAEFNNS